jgi:mono/diheme cytochrome c family protein
MKAKLFSRFHGLPLGVGLLVTIAPFLMAGRAAAQEGTPGAGVYKAKCQACHGPDGSGNTPVGKSLKTADLRSADVQKKSDSELAQTVAEGKGNMPAFKPSLSDDEIHAVVAYVRALGKGDSAARKKSGN